MAGHPKNWRKRIDAAGSYVLPDGRGIQLLRIGHGPVGYPTVFLQLGHPTATVALTRLEAQETAHALMAFATGQG